MTSEFARLQLVTDDAGAAHAACVAGVRWVQIRIKDCAADEWSQRARKIVQTCREFGAVAIVNDNPYVALDADADGVHLGNKDMSPKEARELLGPEKIIGGTANTFEDIQRLAADKVDYIGLGPLRFTQTKAELSPILGLLGVERIMLQVTNAEISIPIVVIGGVAPTDLEVLRDFGVHGVAVSSAITKAPDMIVAARSFVEAGSVYR